MKYYSYSDLREAGYFKNRTTLKRWVDAGRFPPPRALGPNTRPWADEDLREVDRRAAAGITEPNPAWLKALTKLKEARAAERDTPRAG